MLFCDMEDSNLPQVLDSRSETTEPLAATARRASEASHPARPTNVKEGAGGAFFAICNMEDSNLPQVWVLPDALRLSDLQTAPLT
ncbi:hypothetical protein [Salmonella enterica]|uniref:hypothetical protein n=1 Tax=Salmonella enterica TaxID=28901 RepID=UPI0003143CD3